MRRFLLFVPWLIFGCYLHLHTTLSAAEPWTTGQYGAFAENKGQWAPAARFFLSLPGLHIWLTDSGLVLDKFQVIPPTQNAATRRRGHILRLRFPVPTPPRWYTLDPAPGIYHFWKGNRSWRFIHRYRRIVADYGSFAVEYLIDSAHSALRYNIHLPKGANLAHFTIEVEGTDSIWIDNQNRLVCQTSLTPVVQTPPLLFACDSNGKKSALPSRFVRRSSRTYSFALPPDYQNHRILIDPLVFSSYIGGANSDEVWGVAIGKNNEIFLTGRTISASFPTTTGAYQSNKNGEYDAFVVKLNAAASALVYATFLGGSSDDYGNDIAVDQSGNAYVTGVTWSSDFPIVSGYSTVFGGQRDVFVAKLSADGSSLLYSTFIGGVSWDDPSKLVVTNNGEVVVCGQTVSGNFPTTPNALSRVLNGNPSINTWDGFVFKLSSNGQQLLYSSFIGGRSLDAVSGVALDAQGNIYLTGRTISTNFPRTQFAYDTTLNAGDSSAFDAFVLKINSGTGQLAWGTFLGGTSHDQGTSLLVLPSGTVAVSGMTQSANFPATNTYGGGEDGFLALLNSSGTNLIAARFLGGSSTDRALDIAADNTGIYICGNTESSDFPTTNNSYDQSLNGARDAFGMKWNLSLSTLLYSSFLGGSENEEGLSIAVDNAGQMVIGGYTLSANFPTTRGVFDSTFGGASGDGFVAKLGTLPPTITLLAPSGGESWCVGATVTIRWNSRSLQEVKILLSNDGGSTFPTTLAEHIPAAHGAWSWTIDPTLAPGTRYRIRIQDQFSPTVLDESDNFTIKVPPNILQHPDSTAVCVGDTAIFIAHATGLPQPIAQWQVSTDGGQTWQNLNVTGDTLRIFPVSAADDGTLYRATFSNVCSEGAASEPALLTVLLPPQILQQPQSQTICIGDTLILEVLTDQNNVQYQWQKDGQNLPGYTQRRLILPDVTANAAGDYTVVITGQCPPPVVSAVAHIQVQDVPELVEIPSFNPVECKTDVLDTVIRLRNPGPLDITIELLGIDNSDFQIPAAFPFPINANATVALPVRFTPSKAGVSVATATFRMHPCEVDFEVTMGVRVDSIHLQTTPVDFGLVYQCDSLIIRTLTVHNTGSVPLRIDSITFSTPQFQLGTNPLPITIEPEAEHSFTLQFRRRAGSSGLINATATLYTDRCNYTAQVPLQATQDSLFFTLSRTRIFFDTLRDCNSSSQRKLYLYNPTDRPIRIIAVTSSNPAFGIVDPAVPFILSPKTATWVTLQFAAGNNGWNSGTLEWIAEQCEAKQTLEVGGYQIIPSLTLTTSVQFPLLPQCQIPYDTTIWLTNESADAIRIDSLSIAAPFTILNNLAGTTIAAGDSSAVRIRFAPSASGLYQSLLSVFFSSNLCSGIRQSKIFAQSIRPELHYTGSLPLHLIADTCARSAETAVMLSNASDLAIGISTANFSDPAFQIVGSIPSVIPARDSVVLTVRFTAPASGIFRDTLHIRYQPCDQMLSIPVVGQKSGVSIAITGIDQGDTLDFGIYQMCDTTAQALLRRSLHLTAAGSEGIDSITILTATATPPFQLSGITSGNRLSAADTLTFEVLFQPSNPGTFSGELLLVINPCAQVIRIPLKAAVHTPHLQTTALHFLGTTTVNQPITKVIGWQNQSPDTLQIDTVWTDNPAFTAIPYRPTTLPVRIAPLDSFLVRITFTPTAPGKDTAVVFLTLTQPCHQQRTTRVWAEAVTIPKVSLSFSDTLLDFGAVPIGQQRVRTLQITNAGNAAVTIDSLRLSGLHPGDFLVSPAIAFQLASGESRTLHLTFQPTTVGNRYAILNFYAGSSVFSVQLTGIGITANLAATIALPYVTARPGDSLSIPIILRTAQPAAILGISDSFALQLRFKAALLYVHSVDGTAAITKDSIAGKWRIVQLQGAVRDTILGALLCEVLLGDTIATPLIIDTVQWLPPGISISHVNGFLSLDADYLVHIGKSFGIHRVVPQPLSETGWILIGTPLVTPHTLALYDLTGRKVWAISFTPSREQTQTFLRIPLPAQHLAPGSYILKLTAPERQSTYPLIIIH